MDSVFKLCYDMTVKGRVSYAAKEENISNHVIGLFGDLSSCRFYNIEHHQKFLFICGQPCFWEI